MSNNLQANLTRRFAVLDLVGVSQKTAATSTTKSNDNLSSSDGKGSVAPVKSVVIDSSADNLYKSTLSIEERVAVAMSVGEEVVTEEELSAMFKGEILIKHIRASFGDFLQADKRISVSTSSSYYVFQQLFYRLKNSP